MKPVRRAFSLSPAQAHRLLLWAVGLFVLPMALFVSLVWLQAPSRQSELLPVDQVALWQEPLGRVVFGVDRLAELVRTPADFSQARWTTVGLPNSIELDSSIDLPADAPKMRAWFRIEIPPTLLTDSAGRGRLGLFGNRVMGGPWAVWVDGQLLQANLADWRIQWNTPLRVMLPLGVREVLIAVPYPEAQGYAMGSLYLGTADVVDSAWQTRSFLHLGMAQLTTLVALLMFFTSLQLALGRRKEPLFVLFSINALVFSIASLQWFFDLTGQDRLSVWFGSVMDASITWNVVLSCLFAFEFENIKLPRFRAGLIVYACASTLLTLPLWHWEKNALIAQHLVNLAVYLLSMGVLAWHVIQKPRREGVALLLALLVHLGMGMHTLMNLSNQAQPDLYFTYSFGVVLIFLAFNYALGRRTVSALNRAEQHELELRDQLIDQEQRLATQHALLQRMEIERSLSTQHETIMQDLHDRLGSNLTSALLQARGGQLSPSETVLLLQDLADELRHLHRSTALDQLSPNEVLAELRQRVQHRLGHGGIELVWAVDPVLPPIERSGAATSQHLRALLSEAVANIIKHAKASQIRVEARARGDAVVISLTDNGTGFEPGTADLGRGLPGMRQRARALGAELRIASAPGTGCRWQLSLPIARQAVDI